ncbi:MAG: DUF305 domain-containing protein [Mycobacteriales bacterium]
MIFSRIPARTPVLAGALLTIGVLLTACGGVTGSSASSHTSAQASFSGADVTFATDMIGHHRQAVEMADMEIARGASPQVKAIAARIKAEQSPEINQLSGFLTTFKKPVPAAGGGMSGMDHGGAHSTGMMSPAEMSKLGGMSGAALDKAFLADMIEHHTGAVTMSQTELSGGKYQPAKELATSIVSTQTGEIAEMKALLPAV